MYNAAVEEHWPVDGANASRVFYELFIEIRWENYRFARKGLPSFSCHHRAGTFLRHHPRPRSRGVLLALLFVVYKKALVRAVARSLCYLLKSIWSWNIVWVHSRDVFALWSMQSVNQRGHDAAISWFGNNFDSVTGRCQYLLRKINKKLRKKYLVIDNMTYNDFASYSYRWSFLKFARTFFVDLSDPSSTIISSKLLNVWLRMLSMASLTKKLSLYTGRITLTSGAAMFIFWTVFDRLRVQSSSPPKRTTLMHSSYIL